MKDLKAGDVVLVRMVVNPLLSSNKHFFIAAFSYDDGSHQGSPRDVPLSSVHSIISRAISLGDKFTFASTTWQVMAMHDSGQVWLMSNNGQFCTKSKQDLAGWKHDRDSSNV